MAGLVDEDEGETYDVTEKRKEILELVGKQRRKREYVERLEAMLEGLQKELGQKRENLEHVSRRVENEKLRIHKEELANDMEKKERLVAQNAKIRKYIESSLYTKKDPHELDTVKISFVLKESDRVRYNLVYRITSETRVRQLRLDCCKYWGVPPDDFILKTAANMKVADNLRVRDAFRHGEVALLHLGRKQRMNTLVTEAELKEIQPVKRVPTLINPTLAGAGPATGLGDAVGGSAFQDDMVKLPGLRGSLRLREPKPSGHLLTIRFGDMVVYALVVLLTLVLLFNRFPQTEGFWVLEGFRSTLVRQMPGKPNFEGIQDQADTWTWLESLADPLFDQSSMVRTYFVPLGYLRFREQSVRSPPAGNLTMTCTRKDVIQMLSPYAKCFPPLSDDTLSMDDNEILKSQWSRTVNGSRIDGDKASKGSLMPWAFSSSTLIKDNANTEPIQGDLGKYTAGGYIVDFALNPVIPGQTAEAAAVQQKAAYLRELDMLRTGMYLSQASRVLVLAFTVYSAHYDKWISCEFVLEFPPAGRIIPTYHIRLFKPNMNETDAEIVDMYWETLRMVLVGYLIFVCMRKGIKHKMQFRRPGYSYFLSLAGAADTCVIIGILMSAVTSMIHFRQDSTHAFRLVTNDARLQNGDYTYIGFYDWGYQADQYELLAIYDGWILFFASIRMMTFTRINRRMYLLWKTLGLAAAHFTYVGLLFVPVFVMAVFCAHRLWGMVLPAYRSLVTTYLTLLSAVNGHIDYKALFDNQHIWTPLFMLVFYYLISFLLISSSVAITVNAFHTVFMTTSRDGAQYTWDKEKYVRFVCPKLLVNIFDSLMDEKAAE